MKSFDSRDSQSVTTPKAKYFTESQVAEYTGISVFTLRANRFKRKGIPYSKVGRSVRYKLGDVVEYLDAHRIAHAD